MWEESQACVGSVCPVLPSSGATSEDGTYQGLAGRGRELGALWNSLTISHRRQPHVVCFLTNGPMRGYGGNINSIRYKVPCPQQGFWSEPKQVQAKPNGFWAATDLAYVCLEARFFAQLHTLPSHRGHSSEGASEPPFFRIRLCPPATSGFRVSEHKRKGTMRMESFGWLRTAFRTQRGGSHECVFLSQCCENLGVALM